MSDFNLFNMDDEEEFERIDIVMDEAPISVNHMYGQHGKRRFLYAKGKLYKEKLRDILQKMDIVPTSNECKMEIIYYFPDKRRRDVTNYDKPILDALSDVAYLDDCQVTDVMLRKQIDKTNPRTAIILWRKT